MLSNNNENRNTNYNCFFQLNYKEAFYDKIKFT